MYRTSLLTFAFYVLFKQRFITPYKLIQLPWEKVLTPVLTSYLNLELRLRKNKLPYIFMEEAIFVVTWLFV